MNDKSKPTSIFNLAENQPREVYSLPEIGVKLPDNEEKQRLLQHHDQTLADAERILDEAA